MIVGLTGFKGSGKDTAAYFLMERGFAQLRFAEPLKNMLRVFYLTAGLRYSEIERRIEGDLKEVGCEWLGGVTPRHAMQTLGTEWGRNCISRTLWVDTLLRRAQRLDRVVVPDVRFGNECHAIQSCGGLVFRVDAGARVLANKFSNHSSEREINELPVDGVIDNSRGFLELKAEVETKLIPLVDAALTKIYAEPHAEAEIGSLALFD